MTVQRLDDHRPHTAGTLVCQKCGHEYVGVAPTGTAIFECPECGVFAAIRKELIVPPDGTATFCCNVCETPEGANDFFIVLIEGVQCCCCGQFTSWADMFDDG